MIQPILTKKYKLAHAVKVRNEDFGLLFYLCKSTGLVFINSGNLLKAEALIVGGTVEELLTSSQNLGETPSPSGDYRLDALSSLLAKLVKRGLVNAEG